LEYQQERCGQKRNRKNLATRQKKRMSARLAENKNQPITAPTQKWRFSG